MKHSLQKVHIFRFLIFSSYGQNLSTSTFIGETSFAILISILGLVLFAHLIGNMQVLKMLYPCIHCLDVKLTCFLFASLFLLLLLKISLS